MSEVTVWHDGGCPLCQREIALIRRLDRAGAITFVDVSDPDTTCPVDREAALARLRVRENGEVMSGAAAFAAMWRAVPLLRPLGIVARSGVVLTVLERAYRLFLQARPALQTAARWLERR